MISPFQLPISNYQLSMNDQCSIHSTRSQKRPCSGLTLSERSESNGSMLNEKLLKIVNCKLKIALGVIS